jgi:signal transduction histidine kinase
MEAPAYHPLLLSQLKGILSDSVVLPDQFAKLLEKVSAQYTQDEESIKDLNAKVILRTDQLIGSTSRAYSFLDTLSMGFIMCDVTAEVVLTNHAARHTLSLKTWDENDSNQEPVIDPGTKWTLSTIDSLLRPQLELKKLIMQCLATNQPIECKEVDYGKLVLHLFITSIVNSDDKDNPQEIGAVILIENITQQVVLERSKDDFLSIASHELRTPLTAIRGNASMISKYYGDKLPNKDTVEMIHDIHESSIRLINIVNDFLDASSLEQGKIIMNRENFNIDEIITDVVRELQSLSTAKHLQLIQEQKSETTPPVAADRMRTKQVIINLVGNALKYTDSGKVTVRTRHDDKFIYLTVADTGNGMSIENQRLLFRKFQQAGDNLLTRDTTKSTGLGLYISKLIVELSGGRLYLESSEIGKGSAFTFTLPRGLTESIIESPTTSQAGL